MEDKRSGFGGAQCARISASAAVRSRICLRHIEDCGFLRDGVEYCQVLGFSGSAHLCGSGCGCTKAVHTLRGSIDPSTSRRVLIRILSRDLPLRCGRCLSDGGFTPADCVKATQRLGGHHRVAAGSTARATNAGDVAVAIHRKCFDFFTVVR
jgi:hypothetical protein